MFYKLLCFLVTLIIVFSSGTGYATGSAGTVTLTSVHLEYGYVYLFGKFSNPDRCATGEVVVIAAANSEELARMTSVAITAKTTGKALSVWVDGCQPVPWHPSAPRAYALSF